MKLDFMTKCPPGFLEEFTLNLCPYYSTPYKYLFYEG